jgi:hypothetical protein
MLSAIHPSGACPSPVLVRVCGRMAHFQPDIPAYLKGLPNFYKWTDNRWHCVLCGCPAYDGHQLEQRHLRSVWYYCEENKLDFITCTIYNKAVEDCGRNRDPVTGSWWQMGSPAWNGQSSAPPAEPVPPTGSTGSTGVTSSPVA